MKPRNPRERTPKDAAMDCQRTAALRARQASKILTLIFVFLAIVVALAHSVAGMAQMPSSKASDVLGRAMKYQVQFRTGNMDVVPEYVAMLEAATKAEPDNADVWCAMGTAYLAQGARALLPGGNIADALPAMQKGPAALRRALQLNPEHAEALSRLGGVQALMGSFMQAPAMAARGVVQMNRAVELAPESTRVRLQRAFSGLSLPDALRNHAAEAEDLDFLIESADWSRAGDYVRIMRADLHFETGEPDLARAQYEIVGKSGSPAAVDAKARLSALDQGGIAMSDIKALRSAAGAKCAMCHGQ
jgi:tetratricopeptide (TPR) repeat protein